MRQKLRWAAWLLAASMFAAPGAYAAEAPSSTQKKSQELRINKLPSEMKRQLDKVIRSIPELGSLQLKHAVIHAEDEYGPERWEFDFSDGKNWGTAASVELDAETGRLFSYEMDNRDWKSDDAPTETAAKKAADQFLRKLWGTQAKQYRFSQFDNYVTDDMEEDEEPTIGEVTYDLYINNIRVDQFETVVRVDGKGRIVSLDNSAISSVDKSKYPNPKKAISSAKAAELYKNLIDMSLTYVWVGKNEDGHAVLAYEPRFREGAIDAFSGEVSDEVDNRILQKAERFQVDAQGVPMVARSREEAESLLTREFGISFEGLKYRPDKYSDDEDEEDERKLVSYEWRTPREADDYLTISLVTDRKTGEVISYHYGNESIDERDPNFTLKEAKQIALDTLQKYVSAEKETLQLSYSSSPFEHDDIPEWANPDDHDDYYSPYNRNYFFRFHDVYQDVEVGFSSYQVEIDPQTGKVASLTFYDEDDLSELPDDRDTLSQEEAAEAYLKIHPLEMVYVWPTYYDQKRPSPILLYMPSNHDFSYIDAVTGDMIKDE